VTATPLRPDRASVCVTVMHRSGTSFAARVLELVGVSLGSSEGLLPPGGDNPAGYFENKAIQELDDELLAHLGGSWDQPPVLDPGWEQSPELDRFRDRAAAVIDRDFPTEDGRNLLGPSPLIGFKDPRVSLLLPFWRTVVPVVATVVLVRDPREVAASLRVRNDITGPEAAVLWLRYLLAATSDDPGHLLLCHRDFFGAIDATVDRIIAHLGLPEPGEDARRAIRRHIDPDLDHHRSVGTAGAEPAAPDNPVEALAARVWNDGTPTLTVLDPVVADAIRRGWLRSPAQSEALARARAEAVSFKEQLKRRNEVVKALKEGRPPPPPLPETPAVDPDRS